MFVNIQSSRGGPGNPSSPPRLRRRRDGLPLDLSPDLSTEASAQVEALAKGGDPRIINNQYYECV